MPLDVEVLADQIRRAFWGESWHGPSVREVLAGVSAEDAAAHPIAGAHSIWEVVLHLTGGYNLVLRRVHGERAQLSPEEEWPPVAEFSSEAWRESQHTLEQLNQQLQAAVRAFPAERLSQELGSSTRRTFSSAARLSTTCTMRARSFFSRRHSRRREGRPNNETQLTRSDG